MATEPTIRTSSDSAVAAALDQPGPGREQERLAHRNEQLEEQVRALLVLQEVANTLTAELNLATAAASYRDRGTATHIGTGQHRLSGRSRWPIAAGLGG